MKILQLIHKPQNRGAETFACQLSHHLKKLGHEVRIVAVYSGVAHLPFSPKIETLNGSTAKKVIDFPAWKKLSQIIKEFKPDIIQANSGDTLKYAVLSKLYFKWRVPVISRNASEVGRYLNSILQKYLNAFLYKNIDFVISVSSVSRNDIINHFPFLTAKTEVIAVGLENRLDIPNISLYPKGVKHILHVGGFSFEKNHLGIINIFEKVLASDVQVHLHLIGDGILKQEIMKEVDKRKLTSLITFYGFIPDPLPYIKSADVFILPSIIEGLPGVLLEAMYCKTPVIAYNVGGIAEIINSNTGSLIEKNDESLFALKIIETLKNNNNLQLENAYKKVKDNFMNENLTLSFVKLYQGLIN